MTSSQQSQQALSDPMPRIYSCFCQKVFTTYPGIYLHLKSKHSNLFQKYKKLKITKLFKKVRDQNGSQIYKLDKISEKETSNNYIHQKKIKNKNKNGGSPYLQKKFVQVQDDSKQYNKQGRIRNYSSLIDNSISSNPLFKFRGENPREYLQKIGQQFSHPYLSNPFFGFIPPIHSYGFQSPYQQFSASNPSFKSTTTIKRLLQIFLSQAGKHQITNELQLRKALYDLMVFIDKNTDLIPDIRLKQKIILSYCDEFQPKFIGPLIGDYINQMKDIVNRSRDVSIEYRQGISREIEYINKFTEWLKQIGLLDPNFFQKMLEFQNSKFMNQLIEEHIK